MITLVRSQLTYCESLFDQRYSCSGKNSEAGYQFILTDFESDYKTCLRKLDLLHLMNICDHLWEN